MNKIILERLTARNFKGFRDFGFSTNGGNVEIYGDNGTGKTTLFDGFTWLLFGKDSANRSEQKFEIKELDSAGKVLRHKLEHEVEADLLVNGRRRTFRRVYSEKWTKKRGSVTDSFEGHTTDYYVDGVPVKLSEYQTEVDSIIKEDLFRLLTSPSFFNEQLKKEERRKVLLEICGDVTDAEVIHSNPVLSRLPEILGDRDVENHRKVIAARCKEINKEIERIPDRIDEAQRNQPDIAGLNENQLDDQIAQLRSEIKAKEAEALRIQAGGETAVKEKRIREIESELLSIQNRLQSAVLDKFASKRDEVSRLQRDYDAARRQIDNKRYTIQQNEKSIDLKSREADRLRADWTEVNGKAFEGHQHDTNCAACGQELPTERIQEAHTKAETAFNRSKAQTLEQISVRGKAAKEEIHRLQEENERISRDVEQLNDQVAELKNVLSVAEAELDKLRSGIQDPKSDPGYQELLEEKASIQMEITRLRESVQEEESRLAREVSELESRLRDLERDRYKFDAFKDTEKRIAQLEGQERSLAAEYERLQEELFLTEEFTRSKVALLDSKINSKFKLARFRLFEEQINGGLKEVCDTLYNGVPYDGGLNNAARINVGLDIINTLSEHYGFSAPIFIDNAEAVTKLIDTDAQVIRLVVSEKDKKLRIEPKNNNMQEAI
ncbi:AAA family ATPase [Paenibacillus sp. Marseille-P2973]|uniref:AAA family ATPase n=1 Tax=Paenibacillus sp. Marseille-P2973 TaxID=1871032 RepID=UPI001B38319F|nr:AAA family ATPase [Paenibacillus sp. Marseille-P2973]MBQ4899324.1 AAA family ATPase [Paenibacillus sp. Marseille-P2973]